MKHLIFVTAFLAMLSPVNTKAINFAIDPASPSINGNITPDDVLLPGPTVFIQGRNLGLQDFFFAGFFDDLNALSYGQDPIRNPLFFSVDRVAVGLPGSDVNRLAQPGVEDAARHVYVALPPVGTNRLFINGGSLGLIGGFFGDDLNGLEIDSQPRPFIYFSIDFLSATNGFGAAGLSDDILISSGNGSFSILHDGVRDIGLVDGDDVDALVYNAGLDVALFSLSPFSPSTFTSTGLGYIPCVRGHLSPADVCITFFTGSYQLWASAADIGLLPGDNVNALDTTVPEPGTLMLLTVALVSFGFFSLWQRR